MKCKFINTIFSEISVALYSAPFYYFAVYCIYNHSFISFDSAVRKASFNNIRYNQIMQSARGWHDETVLTLWSTSPSNFVTDGP
jgi:hypothetical protein